MRFLCSVLIAGCLTGALGAVQDEEDVGAVLERFNSLIRQKGLDVMEDDYETEFFGGLLGFEVDSKLGDFSTLRVFEHRASIIRTEEAGAKIYHYDIDLGLENLQLNSSFILKTPLLNVGVKLLLSPKGASLRLIGEIRKSADGDCQATLSRAYVQSVGDATVRVIDEQGQDVWSKGVYRFIEDEYPLVQPFAQSFVDNNLTPTLQSPRASQLICQYYSPL